MPYELVHDEPQNEGFKGNVKDIARHGARTASNLGTLAAGFPGDILELANDYIAKPISESITGQKSKPYSESGLGKLIPTTRKHRENIRQSPAGEYLQPQNKVEKFTDDVIEDTAALFTPGGIAKSGAKLGTRLAKNLMKSIGANLAGEATKQVSDSEKSGAYTKAGALFITSLLDQESAVKQVGKLFQANQAALPAAASTSSSSLNRSINSLEHSITGGRPRTSLSAPENWVLDQADKIKDLIQNGKISVEQAIKQKRSLNSELSTLYKEVPSKGLQKSVKNQAKLLNGYLNQTIKEYGTTSAPKGWYKNFKNADDAYGTIARSNFIGHWIDKNVVKSPLTTGLMHIVGGHNVASIGGGVGAAILPYQAAKLTYRITKSPTLAKIYGKTIAAAAKEDSVAFNKYFKELDQEMQKEEAKESWEFIE